MRCVEWFWRNQKLKNHFYWIEYKSQSLKCKAEHKAISMFGSEEKIVSVLKINYLELSVASWDIAILSDCIDVNSWLGYRHLVERVYYKMS